MFSSETRSNAEIQALFKVRPVFSTLPGVSAPPPFGGNTRTVVIHADPDKLRSYNLSPQEVTKAIASGNTVLPSGNVRTGDLNRIAAVNSIVPQIGELNDLPIRTGSGATVFVRDIGTVENSSDILTGYGLVNGLAIGIVNLFADLTYEARSITGPFLGSPGVSATVIWNRVGFGELHMFTVLPSDEMGVDSTRFRDQAETSDQEEL